MAGDAGAPGVDAGLRDASVTVLDAGRDAGATVVDAGAMDAGATTMDASADAGTITDAGSDAGTDAGSDAGTDAGSDAGTDAGCSIGAVMSMATPGMLDLFGTPAYFNDGMPLPAGRYRVRYLDGCMKYSSSQGWTVNAYASGMSCWYVIGATTSDRIVVPPGTIGWAVGSGAFATMAECEAASALAPPVEFELPAAQVVGVWLLDSPYSDNVAGEGGRNPRWVLETVSLACGTADAGG